MVKTNRLSLNIKKSCNISLHSPKKKIPNSSRPTQIMIDECIIERITNTKFLGVYIEDKDNDDREAAEDSGDKDRGRNTGASDRIHLLRRSDNGGRPLHEGHKAKNRTGLGNVWHNAVPF